MKFYLEEQENVLSHLKTDKDGLTSAEAQKRLEENGKNKLIEGKKESLFHRFLKQLAEPMTIILIVAAAISAGLEIYEGVANGHWEFPADVVIILAVVIINAVLGVLQESKAEDFLSPIVTPFELVSSPTQKAAPFSTHISLIARSATPAIAARAAKPLISIFPIFITG